jgi:tetratricopeptide (TPR) repeat protein
MIAFREGRGCGVRTMVVLTLAMLLSAHVARGQGLPNEKNALEPDTNSLISSAEQAYEDGRFQEAARVYSRIEKEGGADSKVYRARGLAYEMLGEDRKAIEDYKTAIRMDSRDYQAMESLGGIYERDAKHTPEAIALYKQALPLDPRPEWRETLTAWIVMLESRLRPEDSSAVGLWHLGNEKARKGEDEEAAADYSRSLELNPRFFQAYYSRGLVRLGNNEPARALADFEQAIRLSPEFAQAVLYRGVAYERLGKLQEAEKEIERASALDPRDPAILYHLGRILETRDPPEKILKLYETALKLRPSPALASAIRDRIAGLHVGSGSKKRGDQGDSADQKSLW